MALVDERAAAVVSALRDAGAVDDDLRTSGLNLWFDQSDRSYVASYSLTVTTPADDVGRFIDAAAEVAGDEFTLNGVIVRDLRPGGGDRPAAGAGRRRRQGQGRGARRRRRVHRRTGHLDRRGWRRRRRRRCLSGAMRAMAAPIEAGSETLALHVTATFELIPD